MAKGDTSSQVNKDLQLVQQPLPTRVTSVPESNVDNPPKGNIVGCSIAMYVLMYLIPIKN
jgi:hypothetical protein